MNLIYYGVHLMHRYGFRDLMDDLLRLVIIQHYEDPEKYRIFNLCKELRSNQGMLLVQDDAWALYSAACECRKIPGDFAEVGVFRGGSARLLAEAKGDKELHLCDTFEGLPEVSDVDQSINIAGFQWRFQKGQMASNMDEVKESLSKFVGIFFHSGIFPQDTACDIDNKKFSFVHLDVDTYRSMLNCIEWFYPRLNPGGCVFFHDFQTAPGVKQAIREFMENKPEPIIEIGRSYAMIMSS
jgi:O-methyltransferase